jgi:transposase
VRSATVWRALLGVEKAVIERVELLDGAVLIAHVRAARGPQGRCGLCRRRCPRYDLGGGRRRWRGLDLGTVRTFVEADAPRVSCPEHGVTVAHVPWARHGAGHTVAFDATVAWLAVHTSKSAVTQLMRIAWRSVGSIVARVWADMDAAAGDRLVGLRRIGIDEISYKRGHRYLTVVVDHDTGRLLWALPGRDRATLTRFFELLGPQRCAQITHVSADGADWIAQVITQFCPSAEQCLDPFHVVRWATHALDLVRREAWNAARRSSRTRSKGRGRRDARGPAQAIQHSRYALWKNPDRLTDRQRAKLDWIAKTQPRLYRAYLLKEGLRYAFAVKGEAGHVALDRWISWARRCRIPQFVELSRRITAHRDRIYATLTHRLSNALVESVNTKIRLLTRIAFGFRSAEALISLAMLSLGGLRPVLPGRAGPTNTAEEPTNT